MKKFLTIIFGVCIFAGVVSMFGVGSHMEANEITLGLLGYGVLGVVLILLGYRGLKFIGCEHVD